MKEISFLKAWMWGVEVPSYVDVVYIGYLLMWMWVRTYIRRLPANVDVVMMYT